MLPVRDVRVLTEFFNAPMAVIAVTTIVWLTAAGPARGQLVTPEIGEPAPRQSLIVPGTSYEIRIGGAERESARSEPSQALLKAIGVWLSTTFELPWSGVLPRIEFAAASKIAALRYQSLLGKEANGPVAVSLVGQREVVAIYDHQTMSIILPDGWTGRSPAELSVLVHEMVHHLQNLGGLKFACPQERERLAYRAQERWLNLFGRDLLRDFDIDGFTLLATTACHG
jgi:uncharacterized protein DUF6647